jgi:poly(3-hydroxybutyrate) depolymerase
MNLRNAALLLTPAFLLGSCFLPKLKVDETAGGGSGGADVTSAGKSSGTAGKTSGGAGKSSGGANSNGGEAGSGNGDAGTSEPGTGGAQPGAGAGGAPSGGAPGGGAPSGGAPNGGAGGALNMAGAPAGGAAGAPSNPLLDVKKTAGCGKDPVLHNFDGTTVTLVPGTISAKATIMTSGTKATMCADSVCGAWTYNRDYYVTLPTGYDNNKAYPLVFEGPGCGGTGTSVYPLTGPTGPNVNNTVIRVGLTPPPNAIGHSTNPNQGCFDDKEGDDSVDFPFYENLRDTLRIAICYDENRVFASGNSSGSFLANELGCKYTGNTAGYAIRAVLPNDGGLPNDPKFEPTCTTKPMAGLWVAETGDQENLFSGTTFAVSRAMGVNGCTATSYATATFQNFPIGGGQGNGVCQQIQGCNPLYPLVVCALNDANHGSNDMTAEPAFSTFISMFSAPPFTN